MRYLLTFLVVSFGLATPASAQVTLLISNELGSSISTLNTSNGQVGTFLTGLPNPDGLARAADGTLYVTTFGTSTTNGAVHRINGNGTTTQIAGGYNGPGNLIFDSIGRMYVPNFGHPTGGGTTMARLTPDGNGGFSSSTFAAGLSTPQGLAFDAQGRLLVTNFGANRIDRFDITTGAVTTFVPNTAGLSNPAGLTIDSAGNLYVSNYSNGTVSRISPTGVVTNNFATNVSTALSLLIDEENGRIFASSWINGTISQFSMTGGAATVLASGFQGPTHMLIQPVPEPTSSMLASAIGGMLILIGKWRKKLGS